MGDRLLVVLLEHPWFTVGMIALLTVFVLSIKKVFETVTPDLESMTKGRRERERQLTKALEIIQQKNLQVAAELLKLTELARLQLLDRAKPGAEREVEDAFARLERLVDTCEEAKHQPWVRAVVHAYRAKVRGLMARHAQGTESNGVLIEVLEEVHGKAVSDLQMRRTRDGRFKAFFPVDAEGKPFRLER